MKKLFYLAAIVCCGVLMFTSCAPTTITFQEEDVFGRWQNDDNSGEYWVYQSSTDESGDYFWGKTWDENDDVQESDLEGDFHGNGWFKWRLDKSDLTQIHMMTVSEAQVPKVYTITVLTNTTMKYQRYVGGVKESFTFTKVSAE